MILLKCPFRPIGETGKADDWDALEALFYQYPFLKQTEIPSKLTATQLKGGQKTARRRKTRRLRPNLIPSEDRVLSRKIRALHPGAGYGDPSCDAAYRF
jgi:hypothetical protein